MRSEDHLQRLFNDAQIDTSHETDQRILAEAASTMAPPKQFKYKPSFGPAIAAIVLLIIGLVIWPRVPQQPVVENLAETMGANQILTMESLKYAFNQGGMEALDKQYEMALHVVGPRRTPLP